MLLVEAGDEAELAELWVALAEVDDVDCTDLVGATVGGRKGLKMDSSMPPLLFPELPSLPPL